MGVVAKPTTKHGDKHMKTVIKYVGLDVHKDMTVIAVARSRYRAPIEQAGE